jgi:hypothetical protein
MKRIEISIQNLSKITIKYLNFSINKINNSILSLYTIETKKNSLL